MRCKAMLEKMEPDGQGGYRLSGESERCDNPAVFGCDYCQECLDMACPEYVRSLVERVDTLREKLKEEKN